MKKLKFLISVLIITFMFSCSHQEDNSSVVEQLKIENDLQTKRVIYNFLSNEEKSKIWTDRLNELLADKNLTLEQRNILDVVKNYVKVIHFGENLENSKLYLQREKEDKVLIEKCLILFSEEYVYNNFYTLDRILLLPSIQFRSNLTEPVIEPGGSGGGNYCSCNAGSFFNCGFGSGLECKKRIFCQKKDTGCGTFWSYPCDGKCYLLV